MTSPRLDISSNFIGGELPPDLTDGWYQVFEITICFNDFTGEFSMKFPRTFHEFSDNRRKTSKLFNSNHPSNHIHNVIFHRNFMSSDLKIGTLPPNIVTPTLEKLWISDNSFMGELPGQAFNSSTLIYLLLARNLFSGNVPEYVYLPNCINLDMAANQLTGVYTVFPPEFSQKFLDRSKYFKNNFSK